VKIGQVDTEIALLKENRKEKKEKKKKLRKVKYIAWVAGLPSRLKKKKKTSNAWQSLLYCPLGAVVSPPSR